MHWKWWLLAAPVIAVMVYITYDDFGLWPSLGFFALVIPAAFFLYSRDSRGLTAIMKPLAARYGGTLSPASLMNFPQLSFEIDGRPYAVHAMPMPAPTGRLARSPLFGSPCPSTAPARRRSSRPRHWSGVRSPRWRLNGRRRRQTPPSTRLFAWRAVTRRSWPNSSTTTCVPA